MKSASDFEEYFCIKIQGIRRIRFVKGNMECGDFLVTFHDDAVIFSMHQFKTGVSFVCCNIVSYYFAFTSNRYAHTILWDCVLQN